MSRDLADPAAAAAAEAAPALSRRGRDFLLLWIFVQLRHGYPERAAVAADALRRLGDASAEVATAEAVLAFLAGRWREALAHLDALDRIDPLERFGSYRLTERQRMRRYLRTRCLFELGDEPRSKDALDAYLRHGEAGGNAE